MKKTMDGVQNLPNLSGCSGTLGLARSSAEGVRVKAEVNISAAAASIPLCTGSGVTETKDGPKRRNKENKRQKLGRIS